MIADVRLILAVLVISSRHEPLSEVIQCLIQRDGRRAFTSMTHLHWSFAAVNIGCGFDPRTRKASRPCLEHSQTTLAGHILRVPAQANTSGYLRHRCLQLLSHMRVRVEGSEVKLGGTRMQKLLG